MNEIKIPISFTLFGLDWKVVKGRNIQRKEDCYGLCKFSEQEIELASINETFTKKRREQTYLHEVMHAVFDALKLPESLHTEQNVDLIAKCLHQILQSSKYESTN